MRMEDLKIYCKYCDKLLVPDSFFPPTCDCDKVTQLQKERQEAYEASPEYEPPLSKEQFEEEYPIVFKDQREIKPLEEGDPCVFKVEARSYQDGIGFCMWRPFPCNLEDEEDEETLDSDCGLCYDISEEEAKVLLEMLTNYFDKGVSRDTKK